MTTDNEFPHGHVTIDFRDGYVRLVTPLSGEPRRDAEAVRAGISTILLAVGLTEAELVDAFRKRLQTALLPPEAPTRPQEPQQRPQPARVAPQGGRPAGGQRRGQRDEGVRVEEQCVQCGARPIYFMAAYHNPRSGKNVEAKIECKACKDGQYPHLVRWETEDDLVAERPY